VFKRLFWLSAGITLGFGGAVWFRRTVKQAVQRFAPERVAEGATRAVHGVGARLSAAAADGRAAMKEREAELRAELEH